MQPPSAKWGLGSGTCFAVDQKGHNGGMRAWHLLWLLAFAITVVASARCEEPLIVTVCQLKSDPPNFNHRLIQVSGFVSHAFEDFTIFDPNCPSWPGIWLEYGGKAKSGTMYCCGVSANRSRSRDLVVDNVLVPLVNDEQFKKFDKAIQPPFRSGAQGAVIHATLIGKFFAGHQMKFSHGDWGGFGHMGCCTLLAIQQVASADTQNRMDLDYGASPDQPDIGKTGCGYTDFLPLEITAAELNWQREADDGKHDFAFDDPQRVASDTLEAVGKIDIPTLTEMKLVREAQGRKIFEYKPVGSPESYMVVVSRPYLISFYARNPDRVAWVAVAAYKSSCEDDNAVERIK